MGYRNAIVIAGPGKVGLEEVAEAAPGPGEVAIRPAHVGICGTDLEILTGQADPAYVRYPVVPGHEWSGRVEATGPDVDGLKPGQQVIAQGLIPCRHCARCIRGETNICEEYDQIGFTRPGAAAGQLIVPAGLVHVLPDSVSLLDAALAEPAAVAWRALGRGRLAPGDRLAVVGDGTMGLITAHLARLFSPAEIVMHGLRGGQAGLATELGATGFELAGISPADGSSYDLVVEAAGTPAAVQTAVALARRGGRVVLLGLAGKGVTAPLPIDDVVYKDLRVSASFSYTSAAWTEVAALLCAGRITLGPLVTHRFPLHCFADAYQALRDGSAPRGKVLLDVSAA
jgi:L-iditol 2-dehydrogenase